MTKHVSAIAFAALLTTSSAVVSQAAQAPATGRSVASIECSKQADAKGLHGKARKTFRSKCLKQLRAAA
jgi:hypothetical protein